WEKAAICMQILAPVLVMTFAATPYGCVLDVVWRQDLHLLRETLRAIFIAAACSFAKYQGSNWKGAMQLIACAGVMNYASYLAISWFALKRYTRHLPIAGARV